MALAVLLAVGLASVAGALAGAPLVPKRLAARSGDDKGGVWVWHSHPALAAGLAGIATWQLVGGRPVIL